ncbi:MAG: small ribosomal subunit Rsm22 family protein [Vicinamibacterales bacterium]
MRELSAAVDRVLHGISTTALRAAYAELSQRYRGAGAAGPLRGLEHHAYVAARMPATAAALHQVLAEIHARRLIAPPAHVLDLGAGPGTTVWAARSLWPGARYTLVERDPSFVALGRSLLSEPPARAVDEARAEPAVTWLERSLTGLEDLPRCDLAVLAYVVGELEPDAAEALVTRVGAAASTVVVLDAGSPRGYAAVMRARTVLVERGASVAAPCPHDRPCPLTAGDWCHVAARVQRSRVHRAVKATQLSYEDEPFCYVAAVERPVAERRGRVIARPRAQKGYVTLDLCLADGLDRGRKVTRSMGPAFKEARHLSWGSPLGEVVADALRQKTALP